MTISTGPAASSARFAGSEPNTPLQALTTLNDPFFFEAARAMAGGWNSMARPMRSALTTVSDCRFAADLEGGER